MSMLKGLAKRSGIGLALSQGVDTARYASGNIDKDEYKKRTVCNGGGAAGTAVGAAIGTAICPGVGTAIGGFIGGAAGKSGTRRILDDKE